MTFVLPEAPHLPGRTPRPSEALFAPLKAGLPKDARGLLSSDAFKGGFAAFEARYYWEAHELWEAVWSALAPAGAERLWVSGLIQLANSGLKARLGRRVAAARCLALADGLLAEAQTRGAALSATIDPAALRRQVVNEVADYEI